MFCVVAGRRFWGIIGSVSGKAEASIKIHKARAKWDAEFSKEYLATNEKELLPNNTASINIFEKLVGYSLNEQHERGKHKAAVFKSALGYTSKDAELLSQAIRNGLTKNKAYFVGNNGYGDQYRVIILVDGINEKAGTKQPIVTGWIIRNGETIPRMVNAIVSDDKRS